MKLLQIYKDLLLEVGEGNSQIYKWGAKPLSGVMNPLKKNKKHLINFDTDSNLTYEVIIEWYPKREGLAIGFSVVSDKELEYKVTNRGELFRIMSTVKDIVENYIKKYDPMYLYWSSSASKMSNMGSGKEQRDKLYLNYVLKNTTVIGTQDTGDYMVVKIR